MVPYFSKRQSSDIHARRKQSTHPLEDPLNHEDQRDFLFIYERWRITKKAIGQLLQR